MFTYRDVFVEFDKGLSSISWSERTFVRAIAIVAAALSIVAAIGESLHVYRLLDSAGSPWSVAINYAVVWRRYWISAGLTVSLVAIWPFKAKRYILAALALAFVTIQYLSWFKESIRVKEYYNILGVNHIPEPSVASLYGATWWDILALGSYLLLFAFVAKTILTISISSIWAVRRLFTSEP